MSVDRFHRIVWFFSPWGGKGGGACCVGLILFASINMFRAADRLRLDDVLYVDEHLKSQVRLKVVKPGALSLSRDGSGVIETIPAGRTVRLVGLATDQEHYLVEVEWMKSGGRAEGWMATANLEAIPEAVQKELQQRSREAVKIKEAMKRGEIEIGMSTEMVQGILGKATSRSSITEAAGSFEQWTYTAYKTVAMHVPQIVNGTNTLCVVNRKMPAGTKIVTFQDKKVVRFETKDEDLSPQQGRQIIVPPIYVQ